MKSVLQAGWLLTVAVGNTFVLVVAQAAPMAQVWFGSQNSGNAFEQAAGWPCPGGTAFLHSSRLLQLSDGRLLGRVLPSGAVALRKPPSGSK